MSIAIMRAERSYERTSRSLLAGMPRPKPFCKFSGGRLLTGTKSLHRTRQARIWRLFWRIKQVRPRP